jgi:hypothetical protein
MTFRSMSFSIFVSTWLVRFVDPKKTHPNPLVKYVVFVVISLAAIDVRCLQSALTAGCPYGVPSLARIRPGRCDQLFPVHRSVIESQGFI